MEVIRKVVNHRGLERSWYPLDADDCVATSLYVLEIFAGYLDTKVIDPVHSSCYKLIELCLTAGLSRCFEDNRCRNSKDILHIRIKKCEACNSYESHCLDGLDT